MLRPSTFEANLQDLDGLYDFLARQRPRYPQIAAPTVIIAGDADPIVRTPVHAEAMARDVPGARLVVLPGTGHMLHYTASDAVVAEVEALAARVRAGRSRRFERFHPDARTLPRKRGESGWRPPRRAAASP